MHKIPHPYKLCDQCGDELGYICILFEPGDPKSKEMFVCYDHLPDTLRDVGASIIRMLEQEKDNE